MCIKKDLGELHLIKHRRGKQESWWPAATTEHTNRDVYKERPTLNKTQNGQTILVVLGGSWWLLVALSGCCVWVWLGLLWVGFWLAFGWFGFALGWLGFALGEVGCALGWLGFALVWLGFALGWLELALSSAPTKHTNTCV